MKNLIQLLKGLPLKKQAPRDIVVIGDLMLDEYVIGTVERISPEAPVPVFREERHEFSFGGATNVAINCQQVGCTVRLIGLLGAHDAAGEKLESMLLDKHFLSEGLVKASDRGTTSKKRIVAQNQQLLRIDTEQVHALSLDERQRLVIAVKSFVTEQSLVVLSDYAKGVIDRKMVEDVVACAHARRALVIADPKGPCFDKYEGVDYLKPNLKEFRQMVEFFGFLQGGIVEQGIQICKRLRLQGLIVTMGDKGLQFISEHQSVFCPAHKREVYDITGAGDTVLAFMAVGLAHGFTMEQSLHLANYAAAVAVSHHKTYAVSLDELLRGMSHEKVCVDWQSLKEIVDWSRREQKKKIVFTNGCFDLLHSGHVFLLQEAKKRGDILVVAINTDASIKRYKGENRPVNSLDERMNVVAALESVDYVVAFDQDTPYQLIEFLRPDVLLKGGDYQVEKIAGYDIVTSYGGVVDVVPYQDGFSTTKIIKMISKS